MPIERKTVRTGDSFNPASRSHLDKLLGMISDQNGAGWEFQSFNPAEKSVTVIRQTALTQVSKAVQGDSYEVELGRDVRASDGEKVAARLETDERHVGYTMTQFKPHMFRAVLSRLNEAEITCRGAVATALGVKPWEVACLSRADGGFQLGLPKKYVPSKHDKALEEVASTIVGRPGWYVSADPGAYTAQIIPSEPPTFPTSVAYPMRALGSLSLDRTPFGVRLPAPGRNDELSEVSIDWTASAFGLLAGTPGSGKSVTLTAMISGWLAAGGQLVIVDIPDKKSDFLWAKKWVRDSGWGCESDLGALTALSLVYEEGKRRATINETYGATGWRDLPKTVQEPPILVVVDEMSGLTVTEKLPSGVPKDNPVVQAKIARNLVRVSIDDVITRIVAEQRAMGMHVLLSTQVTNANTGVGPTTKAKLGHHLLQGSNPSKTQRAQAFSIEDQVPQIPENVKADGKVAKGVGSAESEGQEPFVYKSYFAPVEQYQQALDRLGVPVSSRPEPTPAQIARFDPTESADLDDEGPKPSRARAPRRDDGLSGAAAAAHDARMEEALAAQAARNTAAVAG